MDINTAPVFTIDENRKIVADGKPIHSSIERLILTHLLECSLVGIINVLNTYVVTGDISLMDGEWKW